jgi:hypothetical protein
VTTLPLRLTRAHARARNRMRNGAPGGRALPRRS